MSQVETHLRRIAKACVDHWTTKCADTEAESYEACLRVTFAEGGRRDGVSPDFFGHAFRLLSGMQCWTAEERQQPWLRTVVYEVPTEHLEPNRGPPGAKLTLVCDAHGDMAELRLVRPDPSCACAVAVGKVVAFNVAVERRACGKRYLKPTAQYHKVCVESHRTFVFREHFDWHYTFLVKHREPYHDTEELMTDAVEKSLTFCDKPSCHIEIACKGVKETGDHAYLADSLLCKARDLLLPAWRDLPVRLQS
jgi:hypothetical protein